MQNKPNFRKAQMNLNFYPQKHYENERLCRRRENKPNQTQFQTAHIHHWPAGAPECSFHLGCTRKGEKAFFDTGNHNN